jgi:uncharacterized phage protein gp47/JayE
MDFPSSTALFRIAESAALQQNPLISRSVAENPGSDVNAFLSAATAVGDECVGALVELQSGTVWANARGPRLDELAWDRSNVRRNSASTATCTVEVRTGVAIGGDLTIPKGTKFRTSTGVEYASTGAVVFPGGTSGPVNVPVRSILAGSGQRIGPGMLTSITNPPAGSPTDLTCTNTLASFGGDDRELDDAFRTRASLRDVANGPGGIPAIESAALDVDGVVMAKLVEVQNSDGTLAGPLQLIISDEVTSQLIDFTTVPPTYPARASAIVADVNTALRPYRGAGMTVDVLVANVALVPVTLALRFRANVDTVAVADQAIAVVTAAVNSLAPGATLYVADIVRALRRVPGLVVASDGSNVIAPVGDTIPTATQVIRTTADMVQVL